MHSDHWPLIQCTAPWAHISDARSGRGQFSPRCPRLAHTDKCPSKAMYKTNSNATQGSEIFVCVNTFFRCTILVINVQYLWHRIVHVVSKVSLDTEVNIQVILLHKVSHLCQNTLIFLSLSFALSMSSQSSHAEIIITEHTSRSLITKNPDPSVGLRSNCGLTSSLWSTGRASKPESLGPTLVA